ncbi:MAG TPA: hypothetical protein VFC59_09385 [Cryobacterium sp.]|nr:hypothetical protein [Cryobacterium sp.]
MTDFADPNTVSPAQRLRDRRLSDTRTGKPGAMDALRDAARADSDAALERIAKRTIHTPTAQTNAQIEAP